MPQQPSATRAGNTILCIPCTPDERPEFLTALDPVTGVAVCVLVAALTSALLAGIDDLCCDGWRAPLFFRCLVFGMASTRPHYDWFIDDCGSLTERRCTSPLSPGTDSPT